jgi:hypothetical protein
MPTAWKASAKTGLRESTQMDTKKMNLFIPGGPHSEFRQCYGLFC